MSAQQQATSAGAGSSVHGDQERTRSLQKFWERYFRFYDTLNQSIPYNNMVETIVEQLQVQRGDLILDAGTGTGNVAVELLQRGARVDGIDFCEPALAICRRKAPQGRFQFGDLTKPLEFDDESFDKVACSVVLHLLTHDGQRFAVKEIFRVLKPGGVFVLTVFTERFDPIRVYLETLRQHNRVNSFFNTTGFAVRYSFDTVRFLYYVGKIKRRQAIGEYNFFDVAGLRQLLQEVGFEAQEPSSVFAEQCLTATARKPRRNEEAAA